MLSQQRIFFDLLRFSIGAAETVPDSLKEIDWAEQYAMAKKQALVGVLFHGIKRLPKGMGPDEDLLMRWMGTARKIQQQNVRLFEDSAKVCRNFTHEGVRNCVLKGQGHALLYPDPYMRTPGDIDIYLAGGRRRIVTYVDRLCPRQVMRYHHVDFPIMATPIEVHFTPSYMFYPLHNIRMQAWFRKVMDQQCSNRVALPDGSGEINTPTTSFNVIYILSHLYRHLFTEGIGLRQLLDYYFIMLNKERGVDKDTLRRLGLWKFAGAVMYVLHEVFALPEDKMIAPMDEKDGRFLLDEVMRGGNFGQFDDRLGSKEGEGKGHRFFRMTFRNLRFVTRYPMEALSEPLFRTWFWAWKKLHGYK